MKKILLTSNGFENPRLAEKFIELVGKAPQDMHCLFIPTAAIYVDALEVLPKCLDDLLNLGVPPQQITVYDLHDPMDAEALCSYDAVYVAGGDTRYLIRRMNEVGFGEILEPFYAAGGVYIGVSAGSVAAAANHPGNLGYLPCVLHVHCEDGSVLGVVDFENCDKIELSAAQAVLIEDDAVTVIA